jgi:hypothetical protein
VDGELVFTVRVTGQGNLKEIKRPDLAKLSGFARRFRIRNKNQRYSAGGEAVEFDYGLLPRNAAVKDVPAFGFVYYLPGLAYQTAYAPSIPIAVQVRDAAPSAAQFNSFSNYPATVYQMPNTNRILNRKDPFAFLTTPGVISAILLPPALCCIWIAISGAKMRTTTGRSHAYARATRNLRHHPLQLNERVAEEVDRVQARRILINYCRDRFGLSTSEPTSEELLNFLEQNGVTPEEIQTARNFLESCDRGQFAGLQHEGKFTAAQLDQLLSRLESHA